MNVILIEISNRSISIIITRYTKLNHNR